MIAYLKRTFKPYTGKQILNRQTFKVLPVWELIDVSSLVGRFYA